MALMSCWAMRVTKSVALEPLSLLKLTRLKAPLELPWSST